MLVFKMLAYDKILTLCKTHGEILSKMFLSIYRYYYLSIFQIFPELLLKLNNNIYRRFNAIMSQLKISLFGVIYIIGKPRYCCVGRGKLATLHALFGN